MFEIFYKRFEMLLGQDLGRCHISRLQIPKSLQAALSGVEGLTTNNRRDCRSSHCSFTRAYITLQETRHRVATFEIFKNFLYRTFLRSCGFEREMSHEFINLSHIFFYDKGVLLFEFVSHFLPLELDKENFFEGEAFARGLSVLLFLGRMNIDEGSF